jgi:hypothetical protein
VIPVTRWCHHRPIACGSKVFTDLFFQIFGPAGKNLEEIEGKGVLRKRPERPRNSVSEI